MDPVDDFLTDLAFLDPVDGFFTDWGFLDPIDDILTDLGGLDPADDFWTDWGCLDPVDDLLTSCRFLDPVDGFLTDCSFLDPVDDFVTDLGFLHMLTDEELGLLRKESHQIDVEIIDLPSQAEYHELLSISDLDLSFLENEMLEKDVHASDFHSLGTDNQVESGENDGIEDAGAVFHMVDQPEKNESLICGQITQAQDHAAESEDLMDLAVAPVHKVPLDDDRSISSSCMSSCPDQDWVPPEHDSDVQVSGSHPVGADGDADSGSENDKINGTGLVLHVPDQAEESGAHVLAQISEEPDHASEDGERFVSASDASSSGRNHRVRPYKRRGLSPDIPVRPRRSRASYQPFPTRQSTQHPESFRGTRGLPDGWTTRVTVRKKGYSKGHKDKTYIEDDTNKKCRSIPDVWKYIVKKRRQKGDAEVNDADEAPMSETEANDADEAPMSETEANEAEAACIMSESLTSEETADS